MVLSHPVAPSRPAAGGRGPGRAADRLTIVAGTLTALAAVLGLLVDDVYAGAASTAEMLRAYDAVTLLVALPALALVELRARRGAVLAPLLSAALLAYLVYTYAYYLFGTGFNDLFLLHVAVFSASTTALVLRLAALDVSAVADRFGARTPARGVAAILGLLSVSLGAMWVWFAVDNAVTGDVPGGSRLVETETVVRLGMAMDLAVLVPLYAVAAVLVWRRTAWGFVLATLALVAGLLHQVSYVVAMPFQVAAGVPGAVSFDPGEPVIVLLYVVATALLFRGTGDMGHRA